MRKRNKPMSQINVVPYIDVMLVLLIIFMITAPLLSQGVKVELPSAAAEPLATKAKEPIIVSIDSVGNYYLNIAKHPNDIITPNDLSSLVTHELQNDNTLNLQSDIKRPVLVKGDKNVDYGKVVKAMVLLQHAGAASVGLMTQPDK